MRYRRLRTNQRRYRRAPRSASKREDLAFDALANARQRSSPRAKVSPEPRAPPKRARNACETERLSPMVAVYRWHPDRYVEVLIADRDERVRAEPFDAIELRVRVLFGDDDDA